MENLPLVSPTPKEKQTMKLFNYHDIAELLQIKPAQAKAGYLPDGGELTDIELSNLLPEGPSLAELLNRRSKVLQSRDQALKLTRDKTAIKNLKFPKALRLYDAVLSDHDKERVMLAWQKHHLPEYGRLSLTEAASTAGVAVLI